MPPPEALCDPSLLPSSFCFCMFIDPGGERLPEKEGALVLPHTVLSSEGFWGD